MLICGVDEAGRGCVLGSLIVCAVVFEDDELNIQVADSKKLSPKRRQILSENITSKAKDISIFELTANDINNYHKKGLTLNEMEVIAFTNCLNNLKVVPDKIYLDAADVSEKRFQDNVLKGYTNNDKGYNNSETKVFIAKHKADANIPVVSAASIIAKVRRDSIMRSIGDISGYSDKKTIEWLVQYYKKNNEFPKEARTFWKTLDVVKEQCKSEI